MHVFTFSSFVRKRSDLEGLKVVELFSTVLCAENTAFYTFRPGTYTHFAFLHTTRVGIHGFHTAFEPLEWLSVKRRRFECRPMQSEAPLYKGDCNGFSFFFLDRSSAAPKL